MSELVQVSSPRELRDALSEKRKNGELIGFLPTMGALHQGHLALARQLREEVDTVVCSIFVNPKQFNDQKDYQAYSVNLARDKELLAECKVNYLFTPTAEQIYPNSFQTEVLPGSLARRWEGEFRPGHFTGMATVVLKLLTIVNPNVAIFGEKDLQQLRIVEQMVDDFNLPCIIRRGTLVREHDGLAMSSRNVRLSPTGRLEAARISVGLFAAKKIFQNGEQVSSALISEAMSSITVLLKNIQGSSVDYLSVVSQQTLDPVEKAMSGDRVIAAVRVEGVRLLDNIAL